MTKRMTQQQLESYLWGAAIILRGLAIFIVGAIVLGGMLLNQGQLQTSDPIAFVLSVAEGAVSFTLDNMLLMVLESVLLATAWTAADRKS